MAGKETFYATVDEGHAHLRKFALQYAGTMAFGLLMQQGEKIAAYDRTSQPCYGEMRPYGSTHKDLKGPRAQDYKPGDLHDPFPDGTPISAVLAFRYKVSEQNLDAANDFLSVVLDPETSPWRTVLKDFELLRNDKQVPIGILFKDTDVQATALVDLWMWLRYRLQDDRVKVWATLRSIAGDINPNILLLSMSALSPYGGGLSLTWDSDYFLHQKLDTKRFLTGDVVTEGTLKERAAYNRPEIHFVFGQQEQSVYRPFAGVRAAQYTKDNLRAEFLDKFAALVSDGEPASIPC